MKTSIDKNFVTVDGAKAEMDFIKTERLCLVNIKLNDDMNSEYKLRLSTHYDRDAFFVDSSFGKDKVTEKVSFDDIKDIISNIKDVVNNNTSKFSLTLKTDDSNKHVFNVYKSDDDEKYVDFIVNCEGTSLFVPVKKEDNMLLLFDKFLKSIE